jgi:hypothetical protein
VISPADSLAALVGEQMRHDPFSGTIFIFPCNSEGSSCP